MAKSIKRNYIYNLSYQILLMITPLLTMPYLSRILGPDGIGKVSFANSVVAYFSLFAVFGTTLYGQRQISYVQDDKTQRTLVFWEIKVFEIASSLIVLTIYLLFVFSHSDKLLYLVLAFNIAAITVDITWFFQGMEEFGKIVFRNFVLKTLNIAFIFTFITSHEDFVLYAFGLAFFAFIGNASLWFCLPGYVGKPDFKSIKVFQNLKIILSLFIPTIAIQIYTVLDKTMIGLITKDVFENGYYEQSITVSRMVLTLVTSLGAVMIPRIGYHFGKGEMEMVQTYMYKGFQFVWFLGIPLCFGVIGIAPNFVPWFFGPNFLKVIPLLSILSFLILAIGINNVTGMQYLIPTGRQNTFTLTVLAGAGINFLLNCWFIYYYKSIGAAIASVIAETVVALVQLYIVRKELSVSSIFFSCRHYLFSGSVMFLLLQYMGRMLTPSIIHTSCMIICGAVTYAACLLIIKDDFLMENSTNLLGIIKK